MTGKRLPREKIRQFGVNVFWIGRNSMDSSQALSTDFGSRYRPREPSPGLAASGVWNIILDTFLLKTFTSFWNGKEGS